MEDRRERLIRIFEDTEDYIRENSALSAFAQKSRAGTVFYPADLYPDRIGKADKAGNDR